MQHFVDQHDPNTQHFLDQPDLNYFPTSSLPGPSATSRYVAQPYIKSLGERGPKFKVNPLHVAHIRGMVKAGVRESSRGEM